ncbi:hypothetical protein ACUY1T_20760 [Billgrantia sp. Q4P2]|uniref:hypothetical protein n=1 Tax=Billgrantia sp. Q4P2 TaxID=3463857 RepID=UPI004055E548
MQLRRKSALALIVLTLAPLTSPPAHGSDAYHEAIAKGHEMGWACYESSRHTERWTTACRAFLAFAEQGIASEIMEFKQGLQQAGVRFLLAQNGARMQESAIKAQDMSYLLLYARGLRTRYVISWKGVLLPEWLHGSILH